jgi:hypothetical protein
MTKETTFLQTWRALNERRRDQGEPALAIGEAAQLILPAPAFDRFAFAPLDRAFYARRPVANAVR